MKISVFYSKENEIKNINQIFTEKDWYLKNNYNVALPDNLDLNNPNISLLEISQSVNIEYKEIDYQLVSEFLETKKSWLGSVVNFSLEKNK